jgi:hypothetical protein
MGLAVLVGSTCGALRVGSRKLKNTLGLLKVTSEHRQLSTVSTAKAMAS